MSNLNLNKAKIVKDEFYTLYSDVENEMKYYEEYFENKIVYCNCDNPIHSNFWLYFAVNFERLKIKKVISTYIDDMSYVYERINVNGKPIISKTKLESNGSFDSDECIEILKECDVVVTNPPFSLFRDYVNQLIQYKKRFLVVNTLNAITNPVIFNEVKNNKLWLGVNNIKGFVNPTGEIKKFGNTIWYTNIKHNNINESLLLTKQYTETSYLKYDNYDAVNINYVKDIPIDYNGYMGVPISFLEKYNPNQFRIVKLLEGKYRYVQGKAIYQRLIIIKIT